mgnify:CR=1 FL=1
MRHKNRYIEPMAATMQGSHSISGTEPVSCINTASPAIQIRLLTVLRLAE